MELREANLLLQPGYLALETGYERLPNGQLLVAALTRMPRCKGRMVDWWFGHIDSMARYKMWEPKAHLHSEWDEHWSPGNYVGASHIMEEEMGGRRFKGRVHFRPPSDFLDTTRFQEAAIGVAVCADGYDRERDGVDAHIIHLVRDTDFGCEVRCRFWLLHAPDAAVAAVLDHCLEEMGNLADFLPELYAREAAGS